MKRYRILVFNLCLITSACGRIGVEYLSLEPEDSASETLDDTAFDTDTGEDDDTNTGSDPDTETNAIQTECETTYRNALVCTGFEDGITLDTHNIYQGSLQTVSTPVNDGFAALHAHVDRERSFANVSGIFSPMTDGTLYFRAYYFIPENDLDGNIKLAAFDGDDPNSVDDALDADFFVNPDGALWIYLHEPNSPSLVESSPGIVPVNLWFCLSGSMAISDTVGSIALSIDGQEQLSMTDVDTSLANGVSMADFGIGWFDGIGGSPSVYVDDIVVDIAPVYCR